MNKIDYSYIKYPDDSYQREKGRRNQIHELASRLNRKPIKELNQEEIGEASIKVLRREMRCIAYNNYRKMHGLPMRRKGRLYT